MNLQDYQLLESYKKLMHFVSHLLSQDCEIVLHKVQDDTCVIEEIINPIITGRKKGQFTDVLGLYHSVEHANEDYSNTRYYTSKDGNTVKANTFFIKNTEKKLVGMMCVNMNVSALVDVHNWIVNFMEGFVPKVLESDLQTTDTVEDYTFKTIDQVILEGKIEPTRMSVEEKIEILRVLDTKGVFRVKGTMNYISKKLSISEPTLYRYLKEI
ncbi:MAG: PAS domain-containing protein [Clostridia bacterium]|nr:PAS domain-containing protein [Clostridia bacterium]